MSEWYARERRALEVERDELRQDLDLLLGALQPFLVDLGVGCGYEALEHIRETAEEIEQRQRKKETK